MGADLSQLMATLFTALFILGWVQGKQHRGHQHHWLMLGGMVTMVGFLPLLSLPAVGRAGVLKGKKDSAGLRLFTITCLFPS